MAVYNLITGLKRRMPRCLTPKKKRKTTSSTVAGRMIAEDAMDAFFVYMIGHKKVLLYLVCLLGMGFDLTTEQGHYLKSFLLLCAVNYAQKAVRMLQLDSEIMNLCEVDLEDNGYNKELVDITLDSFTNDDECENNTRFG